MARNRRTACIIDLDARCIARSQSFANDAEGFQHILGRLAAVTAAAGKRCPIAWRIMTDQRDDLPRRPTARS